MTKVDLSSSKVPTQAPKWLDVYGKRLWPKLTNYLNKNSKVLRADEYLVQQYCSAYGIYRIAYENLQKHGIEQKVYKTTVSPIDGKVVSREFAGYRKNPACQMMSDSFSKLNSIGKQLGLSPKARSEMIGYKAPEAKKKKSANESVKEFLEK